MRGGVARSGMRFGVMPVPTSEGEQKNAVGNKGTNSPEDRSAENLLPASRSPVKFMYLRFCEVDLVAQLDKPAQVDLRVGLVDDTPCEKTDRADEAERAKPPELATWPAHPAFTTARPTL